MARNHGKPNKQDASPALAAAGTDGADTLIGSNDSLNPDTLDGGAGDDLFDSFQGADTLIGGSGSDTFKVHSWASSGALGGVDTIMDFEAADKIDLSNINFYSGADHMDVRAVTWADVNLEAIAGGNVLHVAVWEGDDRWDVTMVVLGETPTEASFTFAP